MVNVVQAIRSHKLLAVALMSVLMMFALMMSVVSSASASHPALPEPGYTVLYEFSADPNVLWPPNHKMRAVTVSVDASDVCSGVSCKIISVSSDEDENGKGDGNTSPDYEITGDLTVDLRAERSGLGDGRVYTITVECTDGSGNSSESTVTVSVPHDQGGDNGGGNGKAKGKNK